MDSQNPTRYQVTAMPTAKRVLHLATLALLIVAVGTFLAWSYMWYIIGHQRFSVEARLLNAEGKIGFTPLNYRTNVTSWPKDDDKTMDEIAASAAVLVRSGLWIKHLVLAGDREYAFCPFGRVYVLRSTALDSSEVESSFVWEGQPHDYPFPKRGS